MQRNKSSMKRDRDSVAAKKILSQLSEDEALVEEIRKIVLMGITSQSSSKQRPSQSLSQRVELDDTGGASEPASSSNQFTIRNPWHKNKEHRAITTESDEDLAFSVSKDSDQYQNILSTVKWYRDSFLIGTSFADQRCAERESNKEKKFMGNTSIRKNAIPKSDPSTAMAHPLLISSAESYLRSIAAVDMLRPYATWAVSIDGPLVGTAIQSLAQSILWSQSSCDWAMRENLLWVLKDQEWKEFAKTITTRYVDRSYKGGNEL
ncbi:hypothetical protein ACHAXA_003558 [Cyclostephanos tholiformis]|uniref:Uncharacterized protein n=1 Tax=Cyclostephanos tholiformis TaxID=382380 RepID=A0ABD3R7M3_9STRA